MESLTGKFGVLTSHISDRCVKCYTEFPGEYSFNTVLRVEQPQLAVVVETQGEYIRILVAGIVLWIEDYKFKVIQ